VYQSLLNSFFGELIQFLVAAKYRWQYTLNKTVVQLIPDSIP